MNACTKEQLDKILGWAEFTGSLKYMADTANAAGHCAMSGLVVYGGQRPALSKPQVYELAEGEQPGAGLTELLLGDQLHGGGKLRDDILMVVTAHPGGHTPCTTLEDHLLLEKLNTRLPEPGVIGGILTKRLVSGVEGMEPFASYRLGLYTSRKAEPKSPTRPGIPVVNFASNMRAASVAERRLATLFPPER